MWLKWLECLKWLSGVIWCELIEQFDLVWTDWTGWVMSCHVNWLNGWADFGDMPGMSWSNWLSDVIWRELIEVVEQCHLICTDWGRWYDVNWLGDFIWYELIDGCGSNGNWLARVKSLNEFVWSEQIEPSALNVLIEWIHLMRLEWNEWTNWTAWSNVNWMD
jgi:hypothetical protein